MLFNEAIFDVLEYHPILIAKLGNAGLLKKVDEATLAKLFRIDRVIIAKGRTDFGKRNSVGGVDPKDIWGDAVILAHTSDQWDQPCAGKTFSLQYKEADSEGYGCGRGMKKTAAYSEASTYRQRMKPTRSWFVKTLFTQSRKFSDEKVYNCEGNDHCRYCCYSASLRGYRKMGVIYKGRWSLRIF